MWQGDANVKGRTAGRYQGAASVPGGERLFSSGLLTGCLLTTISLDRKRGGHHPVFSAVAGWGRVWRKTQKVRKSV